MPVFDPKTVVDGFIGAATINDGLNPSALNESEAAFAVNVSLRGGYPRTRPPFVRRHLSFPTDEVEAWFNTHNGQGGVIYNSAIETDFGVIAVGGRMFKVELSRDYEVTEITPTIPTGVSASFISPGIGVSVSVALDDLSRLNEDYPVFIKDGYYSISSIEANAVILVNQTATPGVNIGIGTPALVMDANSPSQPKVWMQQAEQYLIVQDGLSRAMIFDGSTSRRATFQPLEIPTGTAMAYFLGRLWVAINDREFVAGDIAGGPTGVLQFTENTFLHEGGAFAIPGNTGVISSMTPISVMDTSLGQGPLLIGTTRAVFSVNAPVARELWKDIQNPIQTVTLLGYGPVSHQSVVVVNGDLFYRSLDGIRSLVMARRDFNTWANTPISREIRRAVTNEDPDLTTYSSAVLFDNRLLTTVRHLPDGDSAFGTALAVMDFDPVGSITQRFNPSWDGVWTGVCMWSIFSGTYNLIDRCFMLSREDDGSTGLWEVLNDGGHDEDGKKIDCILEMRSWKFRNLFELKKIKRAEVWIDDVVGEVDLDLSYRPDQYPCWYEWGDRKTICAQARQCDPASFECETIQNFKEGYKTRLRWAAPPEQDETFDNKPADLGYEFQLRLQWSGHVRIKKALAWAQTVEEEPHAGDL